MIQSVSKNTDEKNYRAIMMDSSSSLKVFSENRRKYYKKYYLNESVEEKDNQAITMGKVVELLLLEPHLFARLDVLPMKNAPNCAFVWHQSSAVYAA